MGQLAERYVVRFLPNKEVFGSFWWGSEATWGDMAKLMGELGAEVTDVKPEPAFVSLPAPPVSALH